MSVSDRGPAKCRKSLQKDGDGSDLSLSGSQMSLVSRPRSVTGKASARALSVSGLRPRRPMSAMQTLSYMDVAKKKRRPYSADSQPLQNQSPQCLNKGSTCFSLTSDFMDHILLTPSQSLDVDGELELSSSTLLSSHMSDRPGSAWMELEAKSPCIINAEQCYHSYSTDNSSDLFCYSDISEEPTRSEKSLGEHIRAMAQFHLHNVSMPSPQSSSKSKSPSTSVTMTSSDKEEQPSQDSQRDKNEENPRNMTTRELHFRMVESGLYLHSQQKSYQIPEQSDSSRSHENANTLLDCNNFRSEVMKDDQECCPSESKVQDFWQVKNRLGSSTENAVCSLDEVNFPEEHDVDSLEGDTKNPNHGLLNNRDIYKISSGNLKTQKDGWVAENLVPVRFQQWVSACNPENSITTKESSCAYYICSAQNTKQTIPDSDCRVEEMSGDIEYGDDDCNNLESISCKELNDNQGPEVQEVLQFLCNESNEAQCNLNQDLTESRKMSPEPSSDNEEKSQQLLRYKDLSGEAQSSQVEVCQTASEVVNSCDELQEITVGQKDNSSLITNPEIQEDPENGSTETMKKRDCIRNRDSLNSLNDKSSSFVSTFKSIRNNGIFKSVQSRKNCSEKRSEGHGLERNGPIASRRKNDSRFPHSQSKPNGIVRKGGRTSYNKPVEESLPGESQTELASWMSLCSDQLESNNSEHFSSSKQDSSPSTVNSGNKDSPYSDILTILRVLEDNEDESSLERILAKRGNALKKFSPSNQEDIVDSITLNSMSISNKFEEGNKPPEHNSPSVLEMLPDTVKSKMRSQSVPEVINDPRDKDIPANPPSVSSQRGDLRLDEKDLLTLLDAVDQSCSIVHTNSQSSVAGAQRKISVNFPELEELLLMGQSDLAHKIVSLRLSLEERDATITLLKSALHELKENQERKDAVYSKELEDRTRRVRVECEAVVKRHQKFIDQLIADKKSLSERCESLIQEGQQAVEKYNKSLSNLEEKHKVELQRMKDITAATEKLKRERWVETKTKKIKELTVRGLEPELTRLSAQHEQEMSALRALHAQEIEQIELRAARRASQQIETLREQLIQEKEDALAREREILRQRMEKQQLLYEEEGSEQRRRLVADIRREKDRIATLEARLETQFEERKRTLERELEQERERLRREYAEKIDEIQRKQQLEISQLRETLKAEKDVWLENFQYQQKQCLAQTTAEIREQLKRERDREIEVVIERLENEASLSREEMEKASENRLRRVRDQLTSELQEVECSLNCLKDKYTEVRGQLQEKEDKLVSVEISNHSLQTQLLETQKVADQLSAERADLKQILRSEINSELEALRNQLADQHSRHQQDLKVFTDQAERERNNHQQELQQLYNRVRLAIAKKEEVVQAARDKQKAAEEQSAHFQALLEQRRRESILS